VKAKRENFEWLVALGKILTMDNLRKWHIIVVDWCCLCKKNGETVGGLLLHCEVACAIWNVFSVDLGYLGSCLDE
jgi:predicted DNA-binding protein with PD1-like motif